MTYSLRPGSQPLLVSIPHMGTGVPEGLRDSQAAHASIADAVVRASTRDTRFTHALNGRIKGGYITRRYGRPVGNVDAVQLELCECTYMREEAPFEWVDERARQVQPVVHSMVEAALQACRKLYV
jgi:N-formylglutamate deformylase